MFLLSMLGTLLHPTAPRHTLPRVAPSRRPLCPLTGLSPTQLTAAAAAVELQPGCRGTLQRLLATRTPLRVVSVNWSAAFVAAALGLPLPPTTDVAVAAADLATAGVSSGMVVANQLEVGPLGTTTGRIKRGVQCARDKVAAFEAMVAGCGVAGGGAGHGVTVYIGDSTSDLGAMLKVGARVMGGACDASASTFTPSSHFAKLHFKHCSPCTRSLHPHAAAAAVNVVADWLSGMECERCCHDLPPEVLPSQTDV